MIRRIALLVAGLGTTVLILGVGFGLLSGGGVGGAPLWLGVPLALLVLGASLWKLLRQPSRERFAPPPWTDAGAMVETPPESTPDTDPISGTALASILRDAVSDARSEETVDAGLATVREPLRATLVATLRQGGWERDRIEAALAEGAWTDDRVAAAVIDENVAPPERSLRRRLWAWLFPEKAIRHRTGRAVGAIAAAAEATLPAVVGQDAPRPVPVMEPTLDDLQRAADGSLKRAVEGSASVGARSYEKDVPDEPPADSGGPADGERPDGRDGRGDRRDAAAASGETDERADPVGWPSADAGGED